MRDAILLDSDVVLKICIYALLIWEEGGLFHGRELSTLAASEFILPKRLARSGKLNDPSRAKTVLTELMARITFVEPDSDEVALAANLELAAQRAGLAFDVGESQLLSILVTRGAALLITGDKRAIGALGRLALSQPLIEGAAGKIACLEQLFVELIQQVGGDLLRAAVCAEPHADKALSICFCCSSASTSDDQYLAGLMSYLAEVRKAAGAVLRQGDLALA